MPTDARLWIVLIQKRVKRPWKIVARARTRKEARDAAELFVTFNHVRVTKLLPDEHRLLDGCSMPSAKSSPAATIAPSATGGGLLARISAAVRRGWMAVARRVTGRIWLTTGRQRKPSCWGTGSGTEQ